MAKGVVILGIESSCDDTSAAVLRDTTLLSNFIANQQIHESYGGVVPELASRAHQQNIIPVVDHALRIAGVDRSEINAVAFTRGPGLMGSLLVGVSFAKGFALANRIPMVEVNHLHGHILVHCIDEIGKQLPHPKYPFLCLLVSGGHSQIVVVKSPLQMEIIGQTLDDAAGEAFDKCAKVLGLGYPGGPVVDKLAKDGDPNAFKFSKPSLVGLNYSFSGLKTSVLYFLRDRLKEDANFIETHKSDICASLQKSIVDILLNKLVEAAKQTGISQIAVAGGVSANSGLRSALQLTAQKHNWELYLPEFRFTTDNAAMIAIAGYYRYMNCMFADQSVAPFARMK